MTDIIISGGPTDIVIAKPDTFSGVQIDRGGSGKMQYIVTNNIGGALEYSDDNGVTYFPLAGPSGELDYRAGFAGIRFRASGSEIHRVECGAGHVLHIYGQSNCGDQGDNEVATSSGAYNENSHAWAATTYDNEFTVLGQSYFDTHGVPLFFLRTFQGSTAAEAFEPWTSTLAANGGTVQMWAKRADELNRLLSIDPADYADARVGRAGNYIATLWRQGEADAAAQVPAAVYACALEKIARASGRPIMFAKFQNNSGIADVDEQNIYAGMDLVQANFPNIIFQGPDLSGIPDDVGNHLTTNASHAAAAALWLPRVNAMVMALGFTA